MFLTTRLLTSRKVWEINQNKQKCNLKINRFIEKFIMDDIPILPEDQLLSFSKLLIKYILNNSCGKIPMKRSEIIAETKMPNSKVFLVVLEEVTQFLEKTYGLKVIEVPNTKSMKLYITISTIPSGCELDFTSTECSEITLLFLILAFIFMKGHAITDETLWKYLDKIKIPKETSHSYFGSNIKKLVTETFVRQLYLKKEKNASAVTREHEILYSWGFRSLLEFPKKKVLEAVAKIMDKPIVCFVRQNIEAVERVDLNENVEIS